MIHLHPLRRIHNVSIHASAREATRSHSMARLPGSCFNPRLREGGDPWPRTVQHYILLFQSTPPRGRRRGIGPKRHLRPSFNPRLREGGDMTSSPSASVCMPVSIHASAREATFSLTYVPTIKDVSIHASAREATAPARSTVRRNKGFNPRLREGGDNLPKSGE